MILSIVFILLVGVVAFFHYMQGFLSATVSTILVAVSVLVAFSFYEPLVVAISPGKFADTAHSMILIVLFAVTYLILRIIFDKVVPGNVRVPVGVDKGGAAVMGLVAGCLTVGLIAVAAQAMPFGPSIGGYSRYSVRDVSQVIVPVAENGSSRDRKVYDELAERTFDSETPHQNLILPIDDMVVGFVSQSSNGGSTAGSQPFVKIHPNYLQELFGNRIGIEQGGKRSAQPVAKSDVVDVEGVFTKDSLPQQDGELAAIRRLTTEEASELKKPVPAPGKKLLIVRIRFKLDATDEDRLVRVSTGTVRLVMPSGTGWKQYFPKGTVEAGRALLVNKPDDFLFLQGDKSADFLFEVDDLPPASPTNATQIAPDSGVFVEAKRYGRVDLSGMNILPLAASENVQVLRKTMIAKQTPVDPEAGRKKLTGTWQQDVPGGDPITFTYMNGGKMVRVTKIAGQAATANGDWKVVESTNEGVSIDETFNGKTNRVKITFKDEQNGTRADPNPSPIKRLQ